jgi:hypothetical protein
MAKKWFICSKLYENQQIIKENPEFFDIKMNPRIIKTANSKPANNEGRLYSNMSNKTDNN